MVRESNYNTNSSKQKPALWKVIKIFLRLKFSEVCSGALGFIKGLGILIGCLAAIFMVTAAFMLCLKYSCLFLGYLTHHFLNLIGHATVRDNFNLGALTASGLASCLLILMVLFFFVAWIRANWLHAKELANENN